MLNSDHLKRQKVRHTALQLFVLDVCFHMAGSSKHTKFVEHRHINLQSSNAVCSGESPLA